jgi:putative aldouronate transport system substrate-binding protein
MKLTVNGQPVIPLQLNGKNYQGETLQFLQRTFGAMPIDKDGKYRDILLAPETKHAIQFLFKTAQGGYFDPGQMTMDNAAFEANLVTGRVFAFIGNSASAHFEKLDFWVSPGAILSNEGTKPVSPFWSEPGAGWMQTFISKSTKEPEKLAKWLDFMTGPEGLMLNHYGIEGVDYNKNDKGLVVKTEQGIQNAKDSSKTAVDIFWQFANLSFFDHMDPAPTQQNGAGGLGQMQAQTAFNRSSEVVRYDASVLTLPGTFFAPGSENLAIKTQIEQYIQAQISKMVMAKDEASFNKLYDDYIAQLKKLKIDELDAARDVELQKKSQEIGVTVKGINS